MIENQALENQPLVKVYGIKNRAASVIGLLLSALLVFLFLKEFRQSQYFFNSIQHLSIFHSAGRISHFKMFFFSLGGIVSVLTLLISYIPNVVISEKFLKAGWKFGGVFGLTYQHHIPWGKIVQIDSGGSKLIQWSPNTSLFYHTGKIPIGHSSDLAEAVISTGLGHHNYCRILTIVLEKAPQAKVDHLTLQLIKNCRKNQP